MEMKPQSKALEALGEPCERPGILPSHLTLRHWAATRPGATPLGDQRNSGAQRSPGDKADIASPAG